MWDFAGDGYVHRLILNSEESVAEASSSNNISSQSRENPSVVKVVEVADPRIAHDQLGTISFHIIIIIYNCNNDN